MRSCTLAIALALAACGDVAPGGLSDAQGGDPNQPPPEPPAVAVSFEPCRIGRFELTCGTARLPLDPEAPDGRQIEVNVYRVPARGETRGHLWMLQGGPGSSGASLIFQARWFTQQGYEVYLPDYRGVTDGRTAPLLCREELAENGSTSPACMADILARWGEEGLVHFGTSDSARDIGQMMKGTREEGLPLLVWAVSYGTLVANRLQHLFPGLADAVVLDSSCPPTGCVATGIDANLERNARKMLDICGRDSFCRRQLGEDPQHTLDDVTARVRAGHCSEVRAGSLGARDFLRQLLATALTDPGSAFVGLSALRRFDRCEAADVRALEHLAAAFRLQAPPSFDTDHQDPLNLYIVYSEFWDRSFDLAHWRAQDDELAVTAFAALNWAHSFEDFPWPPIPVPEEQRLWAPSRKPILLLEGSLDARTPPEEVADFAASYVLPFQQLIKVPYASHGVLSTSQWMGDGTCGWRLTRDFLAEPQEPARDDCVDEAQPPDVQGPASYAPSLYGTTDLWENAPGLGSSAEDPAAAELVARLRDRLEALRRGPFQVPARP